MQAKELVGKIAIRTAPNSSGDWSYTRVPLLIMNVTDSHIYGKIGAWDNVKDTIFDKSFLDGKWDLFENVVPKPWPKEMIEDMQLDVLEEKAIEMDLKKEIMEWKRNSKYRPVILAAPHENVCTCSCKCDEETYGENLIKEAIKLDLSDNTKSFEEFEKETPINIRAIVAPPLDELKITVEVD